MKSEVYKEKVNTGDDLVTRIMNSAALDQYSKDFSLSFIISFHHASFITHRVFKEE
jgi:hypothetical protein